MMMRQVWQFEFLKVAMLVWAFALFAAPVRAQVGQINIVPTLVAETQSPKAGSTITLAIAMAPKVGWHGYWINGGDAGIKPQFDWTLPAGLTVGEVRYPVPERLFLFDLMNHVYQGPHAFLLPVTIPAGLPLGTKLPITMKALYLACTDKICMPQEAQLALNLIVGDGSVRSEDQSRFDAWRAALPRPLGASAAFSADAKTIRIAIPYPKAADGDNPWYYSRTTNIISYRAPQKVSREGDLLIVELARTGEALPPKIEGILAFGKKTGLEVEAVSGTVPALKAPLTIAADPTNATVARRGASTVFGFADIVLALGGALLGGLLLNVMPCVFPVISLKAMSLARAGGDARTARTDALFYSAGTIVTCLAMGSLLLALRAGGAAIGWAFQLQDPRVILMLLVLVTAITLNLAGVFHLRSFGGGEALAGQGGKSGAFWTGALAAFVATPCTGPFMAAALGAALVLPTIAALAIFAGLGLGLASPFLALGYFPALRSRLPRPGPWMVTFQRWMAVPMVLTAVALCWLLWRQAGPLGLTLGVIAACIAGIAVFIIGGAQTQSTETRMPIMATLFAGVAAIGGVVMMPTHVVRQNNRLGAVPFSEAKLTALIAAKKPVFLYFTADWCLTCKVNEKAAIERDEVTKLFKDNGVTVMVGDWSTPDPAISRFLESKGRSGIPLYLFYTPGVTDPQTLPQLLTPTILTRAVTGR
jgi:thiol:disulfide interchange protein/DsbC/DsbD-like thiol-disulfide interchange protein